MRAVSSPAARPDSTPALELAVFQTTLGWSGLVAAGNVVQRLVFGYPSQSAVRKALNSPEAGNSRPNARIRALISRLQKYASGVPVDFSDVPIDTGPLSDFQRKVLAACRAIPYGQTKTYGQLAAAAGSPRAARAVGNCMAANRLPLIVPCHRVVPGSGLPGAFSAPGGTSMKLRLLRLERAS